ncbi:MAG: MaoC family dehydratase [Gammaproteobacteria bacterium]|nr:MAG: MaoC family dehydratase [Gammaproteobacteria bacterium]
MLTVAVDQLPEYVERELEPSDWIHIDQAQINAFADATLDHQFIHVDKERAAQTPFGSTIAHGYLTMSLISHLLEACGIGPEDAAMVINYGSDKVRFLQPVPVDSDIRMRAKLLSVREKAPGQLLLKTAVTVDIKGMDKPALVAEILSLFIVQ